jgi:hypothetical protein
MFSGNPPNVIDPIEGGGIRMSAIPVMLIAWGVVAACFLALLAYRGQLTRYEEDQLFLSDSESNEQHEQKEIVRKVNQIQPVIRALGVAAAAMTVGIVGIFTYDAWQRLQ